MDKENLLQKLFIAADYNIYAKAFAILLPFLPLLIFVVIAIILFKT